MTEPRSRPVRPRSQPYAFEPSPSSRRAAAPLAIALEPSPSSGRRVVVRRWVVIAAILASSSCR
jgi:hypothetical protein